MIHASQDPCQTYSRSDLNTDLIIDSPFIITVLDYSIKQILIRMFIHSSVVPGSDQFEDTKLFDLFLSTFDNIRGLKQNFSFFIT